MKGYVLFICQSWGKMSPFDLDLIHIEQYHSRNTKIGHIENLIFKMQNYVKQDFIY